MYKFLISYSYPGDVQTRYFTFFSGDEATAVAAFRAEHPLANLLAVL